MAQDGSISSAVGRAVGGLFAGAVFGLIIQLACFLKEPSEAGGRLLVAGPVGGAILLGLFAIILGAWELPRWLRDLTAGLLAGLVVGALIGGLVYAPVMASLDSSADRMLGREKLEAPYRLAGVVWGGSLGSVAGLLIAGAVMLWRGRKPTHGAPPHI